MHDVRLSHLRALRASPSYLRSNSFFAADRKQYQRHELPTAATPRAGAQRRYPSAERGRAKLASSSSIVRPRVSMPISRYAPMASTNHAAK